MSAISIKMEEDPMEWNELNPKWSSAGTNCISIILSLVFIRNIIFKTL